MSDFSSNLPRSPQEKMAINYPLEKIKLLVLDVDGVLTDGQILVLENGLQARRMSIRDGYALQLAVKKGLLLMVISGAVSEPVRDRLQKLGVTDVHMGVQNKAALLRQRVAALAIEWSEVAFMGDDIPDMEVMQLVGLPACPADAVPEIKSIATYQSPQNGGEGCVRDLLEQILKARRSWDADTQIASR